MLLARLVELEVQIQQTSLVVGLARFDGHAQHRKIRDLLRAIRLARHELQPQLGFDNQNSRSPFATCAPSMASTSSTRPDWNASSMTECNGAADARVTRSFRKRPRWAVAIRSSISGTLRPRGTRSQKAAAMRTGSRMHAPTTMRIRCFFGSG